jgi:hypothetical protein
MPTRRQLGIVGGLRRNSPTLVGNLSRALRSALRTRVNARRGPVDSERYNTRVESFCLHEVAVKLPDVVTDVTGTKYALFRCALCLSEVALRLDEQGHPVAKMEIKATTH